LRDYQVAVDQGRGLDAVAILQEQGALELYDTRAQAIGGIGEGWDRWRHDYQPGESALIVHGSNSDVDLVNELAQHKRLDAGELGERAIRAVDRDYLLRPGDLVAVRNAAYTFPTQPGRSRPTRIENGQVAIVESVDPGRDTLTLLVREPGTERRLVEIDQARLRAEHAAGRRAAAVRLNYALHSFPAQGATVHGTATLAGHWSQAKQETYVGDTRAVYRHSVHVAREDLGTDGTDEDRLARYAQRISESRQRHASVRRALDGTLKLAVELPERMPIPGAAVRAETQSPGGIPGQAATASEREASPTAAATPPATHDTSREASPSAPAGRSGVWSSADRERLLAEPPSHFVQELGPVPQEAVARERWEREARRREGLRTQTDGDQQTGSAPPSPPRTVSVVSAGSVRPRSDTRSRTRRPAGKPRHPHLPATSPPAGRVRPRRRCHRSAATARRSAADGHPDKPGWRGKYSRGPARLLDGGARGRVVTCRPCRMPPPMCRTHQASTTTTPLSRDHGLEGCATVMPQRTRA
jgi:hypothetical protein